MRTPLEESSASPWRNGRSIAVLREVSAGIIPSATHFKATGVTLDGVAAEWILAEGVAEDAPVVVYFHGGAFLCGTPQQYRNATVGLSRQAQARVLAVDYRLAPEHPHPAAFEDALIVYKALLRSHGAEDIAIAGDSAGASIAIALSLDCQNAGLAPPVCTIANSPFSDLTVNSSSLNNPELNQSEPNKATIAWLAETYLTAGAPKAAPVAADDPLHSPVFRNLASLPPLLIQTAGRDNLQADGIALARRAHAAGVTVQHTHYPNCDHIWIVSQPAGTADADDALSEMAEFLHTHRASSRN